MNQKRQREFSTASDFAPVISSFIREVPEKESVSAAYARWLKFIPMYQIYTALALL